MMLKDLLRTSSKAISVLTTRGGWEAGRTGRLFCSQPFTRYEVLGGGQRGEVFSCCQSWITRSFGNMSDQPVEQVWNSKDAQAIRRSILDGSFRYCRTVCPYLQQQDGPVQRVEAIADPRMREVIDKMLTQLPFGPSEIICCFDQSCNLSCPTCRKRVIMETGDADAIIDIQKRLESEALADAKLLYITGSGDPFGSPFFRRWLQTMKRASMPVLERIHLHTNALLWTPRIWETISPEIRTLIRFTTLSIDAATHETYAMNRRGGDFETLLERLAFIAELRRDGPLEYLEIHMTVQANNFREMPAFVELGRRFNCDRVAFHQLLDWGSFTPEEFAARAVHQPEHPEHKAFLDMLVDPRLEDELAYLSNLLELKQAALVRHPTAAVGAAKCSGRGMVEARLSDPKVAPARPVAHSPHRGVIPPLPEGTVRPLWSVMIPAYNCARDLERSLAAVVTQTAGREDMQIEVVDDCSTADDPEAVVREVGGGRARFYRQPGNVGHSRNFNTCLARARGELVHLLHADDWIGEGFYDGMSRLFAAHPEIGAAFCRHAVVEPDGTTQWISPLERETPGILKGWLEKIAGEQRIQAPAVVVRRDVYEALGGFDTRIATCGEDWEMWVRIAAAYPIGFLPDLLAFYQDNPASLTKRAIRSGQNIRDLRLATRIVRDHLPADLARRTANRALGNWAELALRWARLAARQGNTRSTFVQLREALYCSRSPETLRAAVRIGRVGLENALRRPRAVVQADIPSASVPEQRPASGLTRFVIVGTARTGSTMLISLINAHNQALTFGEIFRSPTEIGWDVGEYARAADKNALALYREDPLRFLQRTIYREWKPGQRAMGFKIFYYHARESSFSAVWDYLQTETDIRVLHIKRRNILAQYLSLQRAHLTNQWSGGDSAGPAVPLSLSAEDCRRHFLWVRTKEAETDAFFARQPLLEIEYEALVADTTGQMGKVQDFLGLDRQDVTPGTRQQRSRPLSAEIANYDELKAGFAGTEWASFFHCAD